MFSKSIASSLVMFIVKFPEKFPVQCKEFTVILTFSKDPYMMVGRGTTSTVELHFVTLNEAFSESPK